MPHLLQVQGIGELIMKIVFVILGPSSRCVLILCFFLQFVFFEQHTCGLWGEHMEECGSNTEYCTLVMRQQVIRLTYMSIYIYYHILSCTDIISSNTEYCTLVMRQQVAHLFNGIQDGIPHPRGIPDQISHMAFLMAILLMALYSERL